MRPPPRRTPQPHTDPDDGAAETDVLLRRPHLLMNTHAAQQICRIGTTGD